MPTYENRPITRTWITCNNCGHSEILEVCGQWGIKCDVCGREGCKECLHCDTFWVEKREYHRHKVCEWSTKQQKLKERYKNRISIACAKAISEQEPDHIC